MTWKLGGVCRLSSGAVAAGVGYPGAAEPVQHSTGSLFIGAGLYIPTLQTLHILGEASEAHPRAICMFTSHHLKLFECRDDMKMMSLSESTT